MLDTIHPLPDVSEFSEELHQYFVKLFGTRRTQALRAALSKPGGFFHLRTNTLRTTNEHLIAQLREESIAVKLIDAQLNAVGIPISEKGPVHQHPQIIMADKISSENLLLGSHLYRPGVKRFTRFSKGDSVTVVNPQGHIVGSGVATTDSKVLPSLKRGIVVKITDSYYALPSIVDLVAHQQGLFYSQSLSAILVAPILDPK